MQKQDVAKTRAELKKAVTAAAALSKKIQEAIKLSKEAQTIAEQTKKEFAGEKDD